MSKCKLQIYFAVLGLFALRAEADLGGVKGRYTDWLDEILKTRSYGRFVKEPLDEPVSVTCLKTAGQKFYIGIVQSMRVKAPLQKLQDVVSDIGSYAELFPGYAGIKVTSRGNNRLITAWEQKIPIFFIPNVRYQLIYQLDFDDPNVKTYRYQLKEKGTMKESDGFVVLQRIGAVETQYVEVDFFDAEWGIAETFAPGRIWTDSVDGIYISDLSFLLKAEHLDWNNKHCREEAEKAVDRMKKKPGERCVAAAQSDWTKAFPGLSLPYNTLK